MVAEQGRDAAAFGFELGDVEVLSRTEERLPRVGVDDAVGLCREAFVGQGIDEVWFLHIDHIAHFCLLGILFVREHFVVHLSLEIAIIVKYVGCHFGS